MESQTDLRRAPAIAHRPGVQHRCPRCSGNLLLTEENDAAQWVCLQCGRGFPVARSLKRVPVGASQRSAA